MADMPRETALRLTLGAGAPTETTSGHATRESEVVALFDALRAPLLRYLINLGLPVQDGEEVVQETFLALFEHLGRGGSRENLRRWLFRVAHNLGLKRARCAKTWTQASDHQDMADSTRNPEELAAASERHRRVKAVMRALPEQDRQCLSLRAEGLRYREIAEVLGVSLGAVSMSIAKSLARFTRAAKDAD